MPPATTRLIPLEDFFRNPEKTRYQISPGGDYLSYLAPWENRLNVFTQRISGGQISRVTSETLRSVAGYLWGSADRLVFLKDQGGDENYHLFSVSPSGENEADLTPFDGVKAQIIDVLEENEEEMIIGLNRRNPEIFDAYRLNIQTGELKMEAENPGNITEWFTDHDGKIRLAITTDGVNNTLLYRAADQEVFQEMITTNFRESLNPMFFTFDNRKFYALSNLRRDKAAIVLFDPDQKKESAALYEHNEVGLGALSFSRKRKVITGYTYTDWKKQIVFLDGEAEKIFRRMEEELPGVEITIASHDREEEKFLVRTYSDRSLGAYYLYEVKTDTLTHLAEVSPWLKEEELCEMKPVTYQSRDGLPIHGYLTLPVTSEAKKKMFPVVVNPHGGPWVRDGWGFNPEVQFLANRGYAVFQMNYRGSVGYGKKFWEASFKQWGRKMQDDITDGVQWLISQGMADPKRIAIYGGSYGGYAALAGLTFTPDLYACGIDYVGVSNLFSFMKTIPPYWKPYLEMVYEMVGHPENDYQLLHDSSPVFHVGRIRVPLLVAQGANDPRVNINESNQIVEALRSRGVEVEYIIKDNEGHGFSNEENRFDFYRAMEKFLAEHLK
jgi:dipeptidyl aminopeptidase/acylaminoacyl peptidase